MLRRLFLIALSALLADHAVLAAETAGSGNPPETAEPARDGRLFDPGVERLQPADTAPEQLGRLAGLVGDWRLTMELHQPRPDGKTQVTKSEGRARITFMNRGHALMERTRVNKFDGQGDVQGHPMATLAFLNVDPQGVWTVGEGNSWTESIRLYSGALTGEGGPGTKLVVHDAARPGGGPRLLLLRRTYLLHTADHWTMTQETSHDLGETWSTSLVRDYLRHRVAGDAGEHPERFDPNFFPVRDDVGLPAPSRPAEAAQFDFLLGEFDSSHWLKGQDGKERKWQADSTAVHALDGHAILEFSSFDSDPNLPDAATTILRIYNRAMRRWESLYLPNRNHRPLYFGGVQEGDRIVLHLFGAQTSTGSVFQWTFFDVENDTYRWKGLMSPDRGETYRPTWTIDFVRKGTKASTVAPETPEATVDAFHQALSEGNRDAALAHLDADVVIFEAGGAEMDRDEYASHHLGGDMEFSAAVESTVDDRQFGSREEIAWVLSRTTTRGTFREREIDSKGTETMILRQTEDGWRIVHIHWSSRSK